MANKTVEIVEEQETPNGPWKLLSTDVRQFDPNAQFNYNLMNLLTRVAYTEAASGIRYMTDFTYR